MIFFSYKLFAEKKKIAVVLLFLSKKYFGIKFYIQLF